MQEPQEQVTTPEIVAETPAPVQQVEETVEMQAARYLSGAIPMFRLKLKKLQELNKTEVARVLEALIEVPLEKETREFTTDRGHDLFMLGLNIFNAKHVLFNAALKVEEQKSETSQVETKENNNDQEV